MNSPAERHGQVRRILLWVLLANVAVIAAKLIVGLRSGSIAVLGDAAHSGVDAINNVVGLAAMRLAAAPPDAEHPYGHGKFETLAALAVAAFLSVTCFELVQSALGRLVRGGAPPGIQPEMLVVLTAVIVVNTAVALAEARASRRLSSEILAADARHTASDVLVTAGVLVGLAITDWTGWAAADAWLALVVALVVARSGYKIFRETVPVLVDERAVDPREIEGVASRGPGVRAVTRVRSRGQSVGRFAELTVQVAPGETVVSAHEIADEVERRGAAPNGFTHVTVPLAPQVDGRHGDG